MKLHLVRHGETEWNREGRIQGWIDVGLNDNGVKQARRTAGKLAGDGPFDLISSSLRRARETALILEDHLNLRELRFREEFRELNQGFWNGLRGEWLVETEHPKFLEWIRNPIKSSPPGGEDLLSVRERVSKGLDDVLASAEFPVILVAHKVVNSLIAHLFGCWEIDEVMDSLPENASVFELELNAEDLTLISEAG